MQAFDNLHQTKIQNPSIFMVSSGRSGTTLLVALLNASDLIYIPYESDFVARAYPFYKDTKHFEYSDFQTIAKLFRLTSKNDGWGMSEAYLLSRLVQQNPQSFAEVTSTLYSSFHERENTTDKLQGIKCPVLISSIEEIQDTYPQAKIIHIVRDGRDVCLSYRQVHQSSEIKFGPKGIIASALYWIDGLRRVKEVNSSDIYELRYEDLITQTNSELRKLYKFIGIDYDASNYEQYAKVSKQRKIATGKVMQMIHKKVGQKIDSTNSKKYLTKMSKFERFVFELIAIPFLQKYNYTCEYPWLASSIFTPFRLGIYFAARKINAIRYEYRDRRCFNEAQS